MQSRRDKAAALRLMGKLLKKQGFAPKVLVTDNVQPISYASHRHCHGNFDGGSRTAMVNGHEAD